MTDKNSYMRRLAVSNPLIEPTIRTAIQSLQLPLGSRGLDAGCGIGLQALLLAEAVGPTGHVTGLDISPEFLLHGEQIVKKANLAEQISFREGDVNALPFDDGTFDAICMITVISEIPEPERAMREFYRVLSPSGTLAFSELLADPDYPLARTLIRQASRAGFRLRSKLGSFLAYTLVFEKPQNTGYQGLHRPRSARANRRLHAL